MRKEIFTRKRVPADREQPETPIWRPQDQLYAGRRGSPGCLSPRRSNGTKANATAVNAADTRIRESSWRRNRCAYRKEPRLSDRAPVKLVTDIKAAKAKPSERGGQIRGQAQGRDKRDHRCDP